jgi:hypothetical protein
VPTCPNRIASKFPAADTHALHRVAPKGDWLAVLKVCPVSIDELPARRRVLPKRRIL